LKSTFAMRRAAYEADSFHRNTDDVAVYTGVEGREQVAGKSAELAQYFRRLRTTGTAKQLQQTYIQTQRSTSCRLTLSMTRTYVQVVKNVFWAAVYRSTVRTKTK